MVWAILFLLGIPLWFIVIGIAVTVIRQSEAAGAPRQHPGAREAARQDPMDPRERDLDIGRVRVPRKPGRLERGHRPRDGRGAP